VTQREKALAMLTEAGDAGVTNGEFAANRILRFGARLKELRDEGYEISTQGTNGTVRYVLENVGAVEEPSASSLAKGPPASTTTCVLRDYTDPDGDWVENTPMPAWALAGEGR
jgi:hypothetical protein